MQKNRRELKIQMKKNLIMFTSVFASLAVLSTGFAAWVITGGDIEETQIGSVTIQTITDNRHKISVESADTGTNTGNIVFGGLEQKIENAWFNLEGSTTTEIEKLSTFLKVTVTNAANKSLSEIFTENTLAAVGTEYSTALSNGYVGALPTVEFVESASDTANVVSKFTKDGGTEKGLVYIRLKFSWGAHFNRQNPYTYYNSKNIDDKVSEDADSITYGDDAFNTMTALKALNGTNFKLTLKTK